MMARGDRCCPEDCICKGGIGILRAQGTVEGDWQRTCTCISCRALLASRPTRQRAGSSRTSGLWLATTVITLWGLASALAQDGLNSAQKKFASESAAGRWGTQLDGTFVNPVLPGDFSDLDAIRVGDDFYAISSTLQYSPGMLVLHSRDLVSWQIVGHVVSDLTELDPELASDRMGRDGRGIWAGAIRWHAGRFWVYFGTPDEGIYVASAARPTGPWSRPKLMLAAAGWDDPCPFWDDDGKGYLVTTHFAADRDGEKYRIHLFAMTPENDAILPASDRVIHQSRGSEANKMYKVDGVYLHYFSEVRPEGRVAMMERTKNLNGPGEVRQLNHVHPAVDKEPNQGGLIQLKDGRWWFLTHQGQGDWEGRAGVLLPVTWIDGWPILGDPGPDRIGEMVWGAPSPIASNLKPYLFASDNFTERSLSPVWEWRYQPQANAWSLTGHALHLDALTPLGGKTGFAAVRNVLTQRVARVASGSATVRINVRGMVDGQEAGMAHFARTNCRLAVTQTNNLRRVVRIDGETQTAGPVISLKSLWLRSTWGVEGLATLAYSLDGSEFHEVGDSCHLSWGSYRGDRIGLYTLNARKSEGSVDFTQFRYEVR